MFSGRSRTRKVDMRGDDRQASREDTLKRLREAREQRQQSQKQIQSATSISAVWRGYKSRRLTWNRLAEEIQELSQAEEKEKGLSATTLKLVRRYHFLSTSFRSKEVNKQPVLVQVLSSPPTLMSDADKFPVALIPTIANLLITALAPQLLRLGTSGSDQKQALPTTTEKWPYGELVSHLAEIPFWLNPRALQAFCFLVSKIGKVVSQQLASKGTKVGLQTFSSQLHAFLGANSGSTTTTESKNGQEGTLPSLVDIMVNIINNFHAKQTKSKSEEGKELSSRRSPLPPALVSALLEWRPSLGEVIDLVKGPDNNKQKKVGSSSSPSYLSMILGVDDAQARFPSTSIDLPGALEGTLKSSLLKSGSGLHQLGTFLKCEPSLGVGDSSNSNGNMREVIKQISELISSACDHPSTTTTSQIPGAEVIKEYLLAVDSIKSTEEAVAVGNSSKPSSPTSPSTTTTTTIPEEGDASPVKTVPATTTNPPILESLFRRQTIDKLFGNLISSHLSSSSSSSTTAGGELQGASRSSSSKESDQELLSDLDRLCSIYIKPWISFCSAKYHGVQERRRKVFPLLSYYGESKQVLQALWQVLKSFEALWAGNDGAGMLNIKYSNVALMFLSVFTSTFAQGSGDVVLLFGEAAAERLGQGKRSMSHSDGEQGKAAAEGSCPLPLDEVKSLVRMMRDQVFRSHMFGCASDDSTRSVAEASYQLLSRLHIVDESLNFLNGADWSVFDYNYPQTPLTLEQWAEVGGSLASNVDIDGTSATASHQGLALQNRDDDDGEDSDEEENEWIRQLTGRGGAQPPRSIAASSSPRVRVNFNATKRQLKEFDARSPQYARLGQLLMHCPFVVPFTVRLRLVGNLMITQRERNRFGFSEADEIKVKRSDAFLDAFEKMSKMNPRQLTGRLPVRFLGEDGEMEAGFGDGVFREFMMEVCKTGFSSKQGMFVEGPNGLYPRPHSQFVLGPGLDHLELFAFLGRMTGKALREGILLDIPFARFFRNALMGRTNGLTEMPSFDPEQYKSLIQLQSLDAATIRELNLNFTITVELFGQTAEVPLMENGKNIEVTAGNLDQYIHLLCDFRLNREAKPQVDAFKRGFFELVDQSWLSVFDSNEVQTLLQGAEDDVGLDVLDWQEHTAYGGGYSAEHGTIQSFWRVVANCTPSEQRQILQFVTSVKRAPLLGFQHMTPQFGITKSGNDTTRLPSAATCMCLLKLPPYTSDMQLREKLLQAASDGATFELS